MKVLLDESLPRRLKADFVGYKVKTVPDVGWQGKKNGELLRLIVDNFDVFITADQNLQYQINLRNVVIPIIVMISPSNRYQDMKRLVPKVLKILRSSQLERITRVS